LDEAFEFYKEYGHLAGFDVKKSNMRNSGAAQEFKCSFHGRYKHSSGANRKRAKTTKKKGCKAMVLAKKLKDSELVFFRNIVLEHNHVLTQSPSAVKQMRAHKLKDTPMDDMIDAMHRANIRHVNVMNVLRDSVGGSENLNMTERDIQNRYKKKIDSQTHTISFSCKNNWFKITEEYRILIVE
jgi:hypothetical protein